MAYTVMEELSSLKYLSTFDVVVQVFSESGKCKKIE